MLSINSLGIIVSVSLLSYDLAFFWTQVYASQPCCVWITCNCSSPAFCNYLYFYTTLGRLKWRYERKQFCGEKNDHFSPLLVSTSNKQQTAKKFNGVPPPFATYPGLLSFGSNCQQKVKAISLLSKEACFSGVTGLVWALHPSTSPCCAIDPRFPQYWQ